MHLWTFFTLVEAKGTVERRWKIVGTRESKGRHADGRERGGEETNYVKEGRRVRRHDHGGR